MSAHARIATFIHTVDPYVVLGLAGFQAVVIAIVLAAFGPCAEATHGDATSRNGAIMTDDHTVQICSCGSTVRRCETERHASLG